MAFLRDTEMPKNPKSEIRNLKKIPILQSGLRAFAERMFVVAIVVFLIPTLCRADAWMLSTSDFHTQTVVIHGIDEHGAAITRLPSGSADTIPLDRVLELTRIIPVRQHPSPFVLRLRDGDLLAGEPVSLSGDSIVWREDVTGNMTVPLQNVLFFSRPELAQARAPVPTSDDAVKLANGDAVHGVLSDLNGSSVSIQPSAGGDPTSIPLGNITLVQFASIEQAAPATAAAAPATAAFRIRLADDSSLTAASVHGDDWTMHFTFPAAPPRDVPLSSIQSIEQIDGPVVWLSSLTPSENIQTPYLEAEYPARFDRSVLGGPIQFGDRTYGHGIGVHAYSRLSWSIDSSAGHFRTQYAVDGDAPYADLNVQIKLDGGVVHWRKDFHAGELSPVVDLDLKGKHTLTLEVIDSQNQGVQARLNWIEPAFLRGVEPAPPR
jgi:hypothetical protein